MASIAIAPALADLQTQLHDRQTLLATHLDKVRALKGGFAEHNIKC
jgi:hypothetical protein